MTGDLFILGCGYVSRRFLDIYGHAFNSILTTSASSPPHDLASDHIHMDIYTHPTIDIQTPMAILSVPFSRHLTTPTDYSTAIDHVIHQLPTDTRVIFTSSTSVYPLCNDWVDEASPLDSSGRANALRQTELMIQDRFKHHFILRLGGICGPDRTSSRRFDGPPVADALSPTNLIHVDDIAHVMYRLLREDFPSDVINICCTDHPTKQDYYTHVATYFNRPLPTFIHQKGRYKQVSNHKLITQFNHQLTHESPLRFTF